MTRIHHIIIALLLSCSTTVYSQPDSLALNESSFFNVLRNHAPKNPVLTWTNQNKFTFDSISFGDKTGYIHEILLFKGVLYFRLDASGILYKNEPGTNIYRRIDKTEHFGYNINSYFFSDSTHMYNIGGYGYWRWTGHLREFNPLMGSWDIIKINRELGLAKLSPEAFIWNNKKNNTLIALNYLIGNEGIESNENKNFTRFDSVIALNLKTRKWVTLGQVNKRLASKTGDFSKIAELDSGLLINNLNNLEYWNIIENQIYFLQNSPQKQILLNKLFENWTWYSNGYLFYGNPNKNEIDSVFLDKAIFQPTGEKVYTVSSTIPSILTGISIILFSILILYLRQNKNKKVIEPEYTIQENTLNSPYSNIELFSEIEKSVLKLLITNMEKRGTKTSTEEINRILGVSKSSVNMQKRKRSDVIKAINLKFNSRYPNKTSDLITRDKSSIDARLQEYAINPLYIDQVKELSFSQNESQ